MNYKNSSSFNKLNYSDVPTAVKSKYYEYSPHDHDFDGSLKFSSRYNSKMQDAKNTIGSMINEMNNKKKQNFDAIEKVKSINADALHLYSNINDYQSSTPKKLYQTKGYGGAATQFTPFHPQTFGNQFNLNDGQFEIPHSDKNLSLEQENIELRKALNQKILENNELLKRIRLLEAENEDLRNQLGMGLYNSKGMKSTNYNSVNYGDASKNAGRIDNYPPFTYAKPYETTTRNGPVDYKKGYNPKAINRSTMNQRGLMNELDDLKRENQRLRQNVIQLLKYSN